jgi:hypothetical protein
MLIIVDGMHGMMAHEVLRFTHQNRFSQITFLRINFHVKDTFFMIVGFQNGFSGPRQVSGS